MLDRLRRWLIRSGNGVVVARGRLGRMLAGRATRNVPAPEAQVEIAASSQMDASQPHDDYHLLLARNVANVLLRIARRFYADLGLDERSAPLVTALQSFQATLPAAAADNGEGDGYLAAPVLVRFEWAYDRLENDRDDQALEVFSSVFHDGTARAAAADDPFVKEAVIRSGAYLGRDYDKRGDADAAIGIYREIMSIAPDGVIARRLMVLLSRRGDWKEAAECSEVAILSANNMFPRLPEGNPYISRLMKEVLEHSPVPGRLQRRSSD
jgi:tetratricopeptide (TPR) repeat protein